MSHVCRITLRPFLESDIDRLLHWVGPGESDLVQWAGMAFQWPLTRGDLESHVAMARPSTRLIFAAVNDDGAVIGHVELGNIDTHHRSARVGRMLVGHPDHRGKGCGAAILKRVLEVAFDDLRLHRVALGVYDFNAPAIRCYEKVGFLREGTQRDAARVGDNWWSLLTMSLLDSEWTSSRD